MNGLLGKLSDVLMSEAMFAIAVFEVDGTCVYLNKMAIQLLGGQELNLGQLIPQARDVHPQLVGFSSGLLRHDGLYQDVLLSRPDGKTFIANVGVKSTTVDRRFLNILMFQDVTLQKKLQREITAKQNEIKSAFEELLKQNRQLRELDAAKDRFIAVTTHELRTPLSAMVASAEILKLGLYDNAEQLKEFVEIIHDQGRHLSDLVNDILDFAKIQAGKMDFYIENHDVIPHLDNVVRSFADMAHSASVTLSFDGRDSAVHCYFDEVRLRQVFSNIVNNGIKYNRAGGSLKIRLEQTQDAVKVHFCDTGMGIAPENFGKVFDEFETIGNVSEHHKGTGLGMPISRKLIEGMGGKLDFTSELGVGSTFWVEVPKSKVMPEDLYRPRPEKSGDLAA